MPKRSEGQSNPSRQSWCTYHHGALSRSRRREEEGGRRARGGRRGEDAARAPGRARPFLRKASSLQLQLERGPSSFLAPGGARNPFLAF